MSGRDVEGAVPYKRDSSTVCVNVEKVYNKDIGFNIFQRSYYDHIIRNQKEYIAISKYIHNNPIKWDVDEYNPRNENNKAEVLGIE